MDPSGEATVCFSNSGSSNTNCVTQASTNQTSSSNSTFTANPNDQTRNDPDATGNNILDQAASEMAHNLNQRNGNERVFRLDQDGSRVIMMQIPTLTSSPTTASFEASEVAGADAILHTEPTNATTGVPGLGDGDTPRRLGIVNFQAHGRNVNAIEVVNGGSSIRTVNHNRTRGLRAQSRVHQRRANRNARRANRRRR